jgi:Xaa-Pro dipeptidase
MDLDLIQRELSRQNLDGWLLYDFQGMNQIACDMAELGDVLITRRWFCLIPVVGEPRWLVSRLERGHFQQVPGEVTTYLSWESLRENVTGLVGDAKTVAMEYVPDGAIPYVSRVDGGTLEIVRASGVEIVSSADLIQWCQSRFTPRRLSTHMTASRHLSNAREKALQFITENIRDSKNITEYDVQQHIVEYFAEHGLVTNSPPIVAVGRNTADPHYQPAESGSARVKENDLVLIDMWAKIREPGSAYADITWMAYVGERVPEDYARIFQIIAKARDKAVEFVQTAAVTGNDIHGYEVDDVARTIIADAGFGDRFIHRTGHNIGTDDHGTGVNFDNLETHDERLVIPDVCCSIEPGIYLDLFGMRTEINIYVGERNAEVTTMPMQKYIVPLLRPA